MSPFLEYFLQEKKSKMGQVISAHIQVSDT
jgi:hypothetical protein